MKLNVNWCLEKSVLFCPPEFRSDDMKAQNRHVYCAGRGSFFLVFVASWCIDGSSSRSAAFLSGSLFFTTRLIIDTRVGAPKGKRGAWNPGSRNSGWCRDFCYDVRNAPYCSKWSTRPRVTGLWAAHDCFTSSLCSAMTSSALNVKNEMNLCLRDIFFFRFLHAFCFNSPRRSLWESGAVGMCLFPHLPSALFSLSSKPMKQLRKMRRKFASIGTMTTGYRCPQRGGQALCRRRRIPNVTNWLKRRNFPPSSVGCRLFLFSLGAIYQWKLHSRRTRVVVFELKCGFFLDTGACFSR